MIFTGPLGRKELIEQSSTNKVSLANFNSSYRFPESRNTTGSITFNEPLERTVSNSYIAIQCYP